MPDAAPTNPGPLVRLWRLLGGQGTGIVLALVSAGLLGMGSFITDNAPQLYQGLAMDDLRFFFAPARWQHVWLYGLMVSLGLWALSALVCTWDSVASRIRRRVTRPSAYGAPLLHVTFVLALVAHLWGGLRTTTDQHMIAASGTEIRGETYRAVDLQADFHPNGMPKAIRASIERTSQAGTETLWLGYNEPLTSSWGAHELLMGQADTMPDGLLLRHKGERVVLRGGAPAVAAGDTIVLVQFHDPRRSPSLRVPVVDVQIGDRREMLPLDPESTAETVFLGANEAPMVTVLERNNPSVPLVLVVSVLLAMGVALVAWERMRGAKEGS